MGLFLASWDAEVDSERPKRFTAFDSSKSSLASYLRALFRNNGIFFQNRLRFVNFFWGMLKTPFIRPCEKATVLLTRSVDIEGCLPLKSRSATFQCPSGQHLRDNDVCHHPPDAQRIAGHFPQ